MDPVQSIAGVTIRDTDELGVRSLGDGFYQPFILRDGKKIDIPWTDALVDRLKIRTSGALMVAYFDPPLTKV